MANRTCSITDCGKAPKARGWCNQHYENWRKSGDPVAVWDKPMRERLESVGWDITPAGCWEWRGQRNDYGYGILTAIRHGAASARVHRLAYEEFVGGPIPDGMVVRHGCDNPPCCNPDHLELGTQAENLADMFERGRAPHQTATSCRNGHDTTGPDAFLYPTVRGKVVRRCKQCRRDTSARYKARQLATRTTHTSEAP